MQQSDVERWLGFITFLCEVFGTMRSSSGEPFRVLVCPIYTCLREVTVVTPSPLPSLPLPPSSRQSLDCGCLAGCFGQWRKRRCGETGPG